VANLGFSAAHIKTRVGDLAAGADVDAGADVAGR
jgi:hypothetical protein